MLHYWMPLYISGTSYRPLANIVAIVRKERGVIKQMLGPTALLRDHFLGRRPAVALTPLKGVLLVKIPAKQDPSTPATSTIVEAPRWHHPILLEVWGLQAASQSLLNMRSKLVGLSPGSFQTRPHMFPARHRPQVEVGLSLGRPSRVRSGGLRPWGS